MTNEEYNETPVLPQNWHWKRLKEVGEIITGKTPSKKKLEYYGGEIPFYKPPDLNVGYYVKESRDKLSLLGSKHARLLPAKSILVTCIGATIGKTGFIRKEGAFNQQINAIVPNEEVMPEYVYYMMNSPQMQKQVKENASATTLPILNKSKFEQLIFPLAPLITQKIYVLKIDELFSQLDAGLASLQRTKLLLQQYRQSVLKSAFEGKLIKHNRNDKST